MGLEECEDKGGEGRMREVVCLVPARGGSKRVKGKNGRILGGRMLWEWSIRIGRMMGYGTYLSTEVEEWGVKVADLSGATWIRRPKELCGDEVGDYEVIKHALGEMGGGVDLLVYLRPTTPFRKPGIVQKAIDLMSWAENIGWDSLRSVEEMPESVFKCFGMRSDGTLYPAVECVGGEDITDAPNQICPVSYKANGYVDIVRASWIRQGSHWGKYKYGFITPRSIEIDTEEDWEYAVWHERRLSERNQLLE